MDWTLDDMPDLTGRTALVTGANSGLGLASAEALASHGALVLLACRNPERGESALAQVSTAAEVAKPRLVQLDLADLASVRAAAEQVVASVGELDILMNNAGVMALPKGRTADGFESQFGTNHLGHFALTGLLLPALLRASHPRVVTTSSNMHRMGRMRWDDLNSEHGYRRWRAYGQSKVANLLFMFELDRRARAAGSTLVSAAAHPGYASTRLQAAGPEMSGSRLMQQVMMLANRVAAQPAEMGALPQLRAATDPLVIGGEYYGPDGLGEMHGHPVKVEGSRTARDAAAAVRLWERSEELTRVVYRWS